MIRVTEIHEERGSKWAIMSCTCNIDDPDDNLISTMKKYVRKAYGEKQVVEDVQADPLVQEKFDTARIDNIREGFRKRIPDPKEEEGKPPRLANYRSETAELLAQKALTKAHAVEFPVHGQAVKFNPNQPILGFDGWGFVSRDGDESRFGLVLSQVKGTDDDDSPPSIARELAAECKDALTEDKDSIISSLISAFITIHKRSGNNSELMTFAYKVLEMVGEDELPPIIVAPVLVRGKDESQLSDLEPVIEVVKALPHAKGNGVAISVGVELGVFGRTVMNRARNA